MITLHTDHLRFEVSPHGAEPRSLRDASGRELLWQAADPWNRTACILFPAICRHEGDVIRAAENRTDAEGSAAVEGSADADSSAAVEGSADADSSNSAEGNTATADGGGSARTWPMPKHGLARDLGFAVVESDDTRAVFALASTDETLRAFPWDFTLRVEYSVEDTTVTTRYTVTNRTSTDHGAGTAMPYALGSHPAFAWPLPSAVEATAAETAESDEDSARRTGTTVSSPRGSDALHVVEFEAPTPVAFHRLDADLLLPESHDTATQLGAAGSLVPLRREFFDAGAVLFPDVVDTAIVYRRLDGEGPRIRLSWEGFDTLTLWSAPGGEFVCIEPWAGRPQEVGSTTPDTQRTDLQHLEPGASRTHVYRISVS